MSLTVGKIHALLTVQDDLTPGLKKAEQAVKDLAKTTGNELGKAEAATSKSARAMDKVGESATTAGKKSQAGLDSATRGAQSLDKGLGKVKATGKAAGDAVSEGARKSGESLSGAELKATGFAAALSKIDDNSASINELANGAGKLGLALTAATVAAVSVSANFDKGMSAVAATGEDARKNINALREAAIDAGADTSFSASEAAGAIEELSKAGVDASDVLSGALSGSLDLAAAGELSVADAAGIASIAMTQFKLKGTDVGHVADLLAAGAGKAMGSVQDLGEGLKQGGLVASAMGMSLEETVGALSAFASAGLLSSDAGTSMKTMLQALQNPSAKSKKLMDELGLSLYDAQGKFAGLTNLAGQLETGMGSMTQAQRDASMAVIFGSDAVRAANILYSEGADGIQGWIDKVDDSGYAAKTAATMTDNLAGDLERLGGSFETLMIGMGSGADGLLRETVQAIDAVVDRANDLPDAFKQGILAIAGPAGIAALGVAGFGKLVTAASGVKNAVHALNWTLKATSLSAGAVGVALAVGTAVFASWAKQAAEAKQKTEGYADSLDKATGAITNYTREEAARNLQNSGAFDLAKKMGIDLQLVTDAAIGNAEALKEVTRLTDEYYGKAQDAASSVSWDNLKFWEKSDLEDARETTSKLTGAIKSEAEAVEYARDSQIERNNALADGAQTSAQAAEATKALATAESQAAEAVSKATIEWVEGIQKVADESINLLSAFDSVVAKNKEQAEAAAAATKTTKDSWEDFYDGTSVSAKDWIAQLDEQIAAYEGWSDNMVTVQDRLTKTLPDSMQEAGIAMMEQLQSLGPQGAANLKTLVEASDEELQQLVAKGEQAGVNLVEVFSGAVNDARPAGMKYELKLVGKSLQTIQATITGASQNLQDWEISADGTEAISKAKDTILRINEETGEITIIGDNTQALQAAALAKQTADGTSAAIKVDADIDGALEDIRRAKMEAQRGVTFALNVRGGGATHVQAKATGGPIVGPGTGTSDDILSWLSNGEHVLTAREVQAMGGHLGVEKWRRRALAGDLPAFANGGAVESARKTHTSLSAKVTAAQKVVKKETGDVSAAQKAYDKIDGTKKNAAKKKAAKAKLDRENKALDAAEKKLDDLIRARDDAAKQIERLVDDSRETSLDAERGDIKNKVTSGLSGARGVIDELLSQSRNTDLSKAKRDEAGRKAKQLERDLTSAYAKSDKLEKNLDKATKDLNELANIQASVKSVLGGDFKLADSIKAATDAATVLVERTNEAGDSWYELETKAGTSAGGTAKDMLASAQDKLAKVKALTGKLNRLAELGISGVILAEIGREGIEGGTAIADALLADPATAKMLSGVYDELDKATTQAGAAATRNTSIDGKNYAGGVDQASSEVAKIQSDMEKVTDQIARLAAAAEDAILSALGLKKDSKGNVIKRAHGGPIVGAGTSTSDSIMVAASNGEHMWSAREVQAAGGHLEVEKLRKAYLTGERHMVSSQPSSLVSSPKYAPNFAGSTRSLSDSDVSAIADALREGFASVAPAVERGAAAGVTRGLSGASSTIKTLTRMGGQ